MKELEKIRTQFLADDIDQEDRVENERILKDWEEGLTKNQAYFEWQQSDITQDINKQVRASYKEFALILSNNRNLTQEERVSLWGKQDACVFLLSLTDKDARGTLEQLNNEIKRALSVT